MHMSENNLFRLRRYLLRINLSCRRRFRVQRILKYVLILFVGIFLMNLVNVILFTSILYFQENIDEPDYDLDTRPHYKTIEMKRRFDSSGNYLIVPNFIEYQSNLTKNADLLSLNLHTNIEKLHLLVDHAKVWDGPISLSLYVKGTRASDDIDYASIWLRCNRRSFKVLNVHLIMSAKAYERKNISLHHSHVDRQREEKNEVST